MGVYIVTSISDIFIFRLAFLLAAAPYAKRCSNASEAANVRSFRETTAVTSSLLSYIMRYLLFLHDGCDGKGRYRSDAA